MNGVAKAFLSLDLLLAYHTQIPDVLREFWNRCVS